MACCGPQAYCRLAGLQQCAILRSSAGLLTFCCCRLQGPRTLAAYGVRDRLITRWQEVQQEDAAPGRAASSAKTSPSQDGSNGRKRKAAPEPEQGNGAAPAGRFESDQQRSLFSLLNSYRDVLLPSRPYPSRSVRYAGLTGVVVDISCAVSRKLMASQSCSPAFSGTSWSNVMWLRHSGCSLTQELSCY